MCSGRDYWSCGGAGSAEAVRTLAADESRAPLPPVSSLSQCATSSTRCRRVGGALTSRTRCTLHKTKLGRRVGVISRGYAEHVSTGRMRRALLVLTVAATLLLTAVLAASAAALPPKPPSAAKTRAAITKLTVSKPLSMSGYSRKRFPHWSAQANGCDTREVVLSRDGKDVRVGTQCKVLSGTWTSYYDGLTITKP